MPRRDDPSWNRRYPLPFEESLEGDAMVHEAAELDRCAIIAPNGQVEIGAAHLEQCVIVEPCKIGDGVRAVAAILQGEIGDGVKIEAHADIEGTVMDDAVIGRGVVIEGGALVGPRTEVGDLTVIHEDAELGADCVIGAQSTIGAHAYVQDGARIPARSVIRPQGYVVRTAAMSRQAEAGVGEEPRVEFRIVDDLNDGEEAPPPTEDVEETEPEEDDGDGDDRLRDEDWIPSSIATGRSAKPGDMARGTPKLLLRDFQPGTARSWVLSKLGRIANLKSKDGRLTKKLVTEHRPDLLDHPVTKEVLRITPSVTDEKLAEMSFEALSPARYDVYGNITFHSGSTPDWQMIGPQTNDVFVLAASKKALDELFYDQPFEVEWRKTQDDDAAEGLEERWTGSTRDPWWQPNQLGEEPIGSVSREPRDKAAAVWTARIIGLYGVVKYDFASRVEAQRFVEKRVKEQRDEDVKSAVGKAFYGDLPWHPDKEVPNSVGWVRTVVVPPRYVMVVEIQSDRDWMKFDYAPVDHAPGSGDWLGLRLREIYYPTFAADALNVVVEWAFANRYAEVIVPDFASRKLLGGSPPKSFYDDVPKKYTVSPLVPFDEFPIPVYSWVNRKAIKVRRIRPNRRR